MSELSSCLHIHEEALSALTDRRRALRERFDGVAHVHFSVSGEAGRVVLIDLAEDGFCIMSAVEPEVGERLRVEVVGLVVEGCVRNVVRDGGRYRVGIEIRD